jgi:transcription antitermination factor NusG
LTPASKDREHSALDEKRTLTDELSIGDRVTVVRGPLQGFRGHVLLVDGTRRKSLVEIPVAGRRRRVILSHSAIAKPSK